MKLPHLVITTLLVLAACATVSCRRPAPIPRQPVSLESLVQRMADPTLFADRPLGRSLLFSSYDRSGGNRDWAVWSQTNANGRITLLDLDGPGYISRIWIATFSAKRWLFYFDNEDSPRLTLNQDQMFEGAFPLLSPLAGKSGGGRYCTLPIPFAKHLRIEIDPSRIRPTDRNYYHINATLTDPSLPIESWPRVLSPAQSNAIVQANATLATDRDAMTSLSHTLLQDATPTAIAPGESMDLMQRDGFGTLTGLALRITDPSTGDQINHELLRRLRLKAWWDKEEAPSIDVPLGDFFCNAFYTREYAAFPLARLQKTFVCRFPMPFRRGAHLILENQSRVPVTVVANTAISETRPSRSSRYFHANWSASITSGQPFILCKTKGAGHYVGCFLTAIGQDGSWNILEGDEFVNPDEGTQPGQFGTGLEDYFNGAYYYTSLFDLPYHGLIEKGAMRTDQYRLHGLDAVDFEKDLTVGIEFGDQNRAQGYMSGVTYWYADTPHDCTLPTAMRPLLNRPPDRFELPGLMAMFFTLEREGLWKDAATRCDFFAARYAQYPWSDLLRLRAAAYREKTDGFDSVRSAYEKLADSPYTPAARQAQDLLWLHEKASHALLGMHMRGQYTLWLDGVEVGKGNSRARLEVRRLDIQPGPHTWEVDFTPTVQGSLISLCLRTQWGDITSEGDWEKVEQEDLPGGEPNRQYSGHSPLPNMTVWQFEPNAYVGMQSGNQTVSLWMFSHPRPYIKRIKFRQSWTLDPATMAPTAPAPVPERSEEELRAHAIN